MNKVISRSILVDVVFYFSIALAGYFSSYSMTDHIVLERDPLIGSKIDYPITIAQIAIIIVIAIAVPVNYNPFRNQIFYMFFKKESISNKE